MIFVTNLEMLNMVKLSFFLKHRVKYITIIIYDNILPVFQVAEEESSRGRTELSCNARRSNLLSLLLITFGVGVEYSVITFQELKATKIY